MYNSLLKKKKKKKKRKKKRKKCITQMSIKLTKFRLRLAKILGIFFTYVLFIILEVLL